MRENRTLGSRWRGLETLTTGAGLRPTAKAADLPPDPTVARQSSTLPRLGVTEAARRPRLQRCASRRGVRVCCEQVVLREATAFAAKNRNLVRPA